MYAASESTTITSLSDCCVNDNNKLPGNFLSLRLCLNKLEEEYGLPCDEEPVSDRWEATSSTFAPGITASNCAYDSDRSQVVSSSGKQDYLSARLRANRSFNCTANIKNINYYHKTSSNSL